MKKLTKRQEKWIERTASNNRRYKAVLYNRLITCILLVLLQAVGFVWLLTRLGQYGIFVQFTIGVLTALFVLSLLGKVENQPAKISWIVLILVVPVVGMGAYFLYGNGNATRRLARRYEESFKKLPKLVKDERAEMETAAQGRKGALALRFAESAFPVYKGEVVYFPCGKEYFDDVCKEIEKAEKFILIEYFIIAGGKLWSRLLKLLLQKAMQGVKIKIIYDDFGSILALPPKYDRYLEGLHENIECLRFNKIVPVFTLQMNHRDHRKILVVDGKCAYTGGVNIADEYIDEKKRFGYWKDSGVKVTGGAVDSFSRTFFEIWLTFKAPDFDASDYFCAIPVQGGAGTVQPYSDSPLDGYRIGEDVYLDMIERAEKTLYITTPYLVPDELLRSAIIRAAARGVDVRIVTPAVPDKKTVYRLTRANYEAFLKAGVKIYEYTPGFIHAKNVLSDGFAIVGTINFDFRSLYHHFENAVVFSTPSAVEALAKDFEEVFSVSKEKTLSNSKKNIFSRTLNAALRLIEPLL